MRWLPPFFRTLFGTAPVPETPETTVEPRLLRSRRLYDLAPELLAELSAKRAARGHDAITREHEAFMLDPGMGPPTYLTTDGRILWDDDIWGVRGTRADAIAAIFAGIHKTGIRRLRDLVPARLSDAADCVECRGTGEFDADGLLVDTKGVRISVICTRCAGLGWRAPSLKLEEVVLEEAG